MEAGPELDALVAVKVMGYVWHRITSRRSELRPPDSRDAVVVREGKKPLIYIGYQKPWLPAYSTDIAAAWTVVEKLMEIGWTVTLAPRQFEKYPEDRFKFHGCRMVDKDGAQHMQSFSDHAETAPLAICLGALRAFRFSNGDQSLARLKSVCQ